MTYPDFINELCHVTYDMWNKGWDEYNGGNVSYRLTENEVKTLAKDLEKTPYSFYPDNRN